MNTSNDTSPPSLELGTEHVDRYGKQYKQLQKQVEKEISSRNTSYCVERRLLDEAGELRRGAATSFRDILEDENEKEIFGRYLTGTAFSDKLTEDNIPEICKKYGAPEAEFRRTVENLSDRFNRFKQLLVEDERKQAALVEQIELAAKKALYATPEGKALLTDYYDQQLGYMLSKWDYFHDAASKSESVPELLSHTHSAPDTLITTLKGERYVSYDWKVLVGQAKELSACTGEPLSDALKGRMARVGVKPEFIDLYAGVVEAFENGTHEAHIEALYTQHKGALDALENKITEQIDAVFRSVDAGRAPAPDAPPASSRATAEQAGGRMSWLRKLLYSEETGRIHAGKATGWAAAAAVAGTALYAAKRSKQAESDVQQTTWAERSKAAVSDPSKGVS